MKFCVDYVKDFPYLKEVDELNISFNKRDLSLLDFLLLHKDKRINIEIRDIQEFIDDDSISLFKAYLEKYPDLNFYLKLPVSADFERFYSIVKDSNLKFYYDKYINSWDALYSFVNMGVSDVYITEELGFELDKVSSFCHSKGVKVRAFPNVCQNGWIGVPDIKGFFIRPEDVSLYEPYIDTLEFYKSKKSLGTLYRVYAKEKKWFGQLKELILSFNEDFDSRCILPIFSEKRISCGKKCLKGESCNICSNIKALSEVLEREKIIIKPLDDN